jgi:hypothetical protein
MAIFNAYFDASGKADSQVMVMAGFISRVPKWERFERDWRKLLPEGVPSFHMTDFVSSRKGWESWKNQPEARVELFAELVDCIEKNTNKGLAISLQLQDYAAIDGRYELTEATGGPYSSVGLACLSEVKKWAIRHDVNHTKILCIFEKGDEGSGALMQRAEVDGFNVIQQSKKDIRAFDACDLAAWKTKAHVVDGFIRQLPKEDQVAWERISKSFDQLRKILQVNDVIDTASLEKLCADNGIQRRK